METITINEIVYMLITVALPMILRYVHQFIAIKAADSKYADAVNAVFSAVGYVNQAFVDAAKEQGNFDLHAQEYALQRAKDASLELMTIETRKWLETTHNNIDEWLTLQIENAVKAAK